MLAPIQPPAAKFTISPIEETVEDTISDGNTIAIDSVKVEMPVTEIQKDSAAIVKIEKEAIEPKKVKSGYKKFFPNIDKNKKILGFFAPGCEHCIETAKQLTEMRKKDASLPPLSILFMNEEADLIPQFFEKSGATYPYQVIEIIPFWTILGSGKDTPGIKYLWNGNDVKFYWGISDNKFNSAEFNQFIKKGYAELKKTNPKL
jgi:thiol-disulfide isomerase/thioredoxin